MKYAVTTIGIIIVFIVNCFVPALGRADDTTVLHGDSRSKLLSSEKWGEPHKKKRRGDAIVYSYRLPTVVEQRVKDKIVRSLTTCSFYFIIKYDVVTRIEFEGDDACNDYVTEPLEKPVWLGKSNSAFFASPAWGLPDEFIEEDENTIYSFSQEACSFRFEFKKDQVQKVEFTKKDSCRELFYQSAKEAGAETIEKDELAKKFDGDFQSSLLSSEKWGHPDKEERRGDTTVYTYHVAPVLEQTLGDKIVRSLKSCTFRFTIKYDMVTKVEYDGDAPCVDYITEPLKKPIWLGKSTSDFTASPAWGLPDEFSEEGDGMTSYLFSQEACSFRFELKKDQVEKIEFTKSDSCRELFYKSGKETGAKDIEEDELAGEFEDEKPGDMDDEFADDEPGAMDDEFADDDSSEENADQISSGFPVSGSVGMNVSYNYVQKEPQPDAIDYRGISSVKPYLDLEWTTDFFEDWKLFVSGHVFHEFFYSLQERERFTDEVLEANEQEAEIDEAYVQGKLSKFIDIKLGRQVVVWGKADNLRVVDVLNPLDNRIPGLVNIEDLRLPSTMTRLDFFIDRWSLSAVAVHEIRFNKDPVLGSDFYPLDVALPDEVIPENSVENTEYGLALVGNFSGWGLGLYWANFFNDVAHFVPIGATLHSDGETIVPILEQQHSRLDMVGFVLEAVFGSWLLKMEAAQFNGLEYFNLPGETRSRADVMGGVEYSGFTNVTIAIEASNRHIIGFDPVLELAPDSQVEDLFHATLMVRQELLNQTLHFTLLGAMFGTAGENGGGHRVSLDYDVTDEFTLTFGVLVFQSGDNDLFKMNHNDRFFLGSKFNF